jgi:Brix domain
MVDGMADSKLDSKNHLNLLPELADLHACNNTLYFEARRHEDLYLWAAKTPNGPSVKLHVQNVHTMDELKMTGNCLKGSRGILSFDAAFEETEWGRLTKELFTHVSVVALLYQSILPVSWSGRGVSFSLEHKHRYLACRHRLGELNRSSTTSSRSPFLTPKSGFEISRSGTSAFFFITGN